MRKKLITVIWVLMLIPLICACSKSSESTDNEQIAEEETTIDVKDIIFESENLKEALLQFECLYGEAETTEEKEKLETYINEYFLKDLNGFYYYLRPEKAVMHVDSDNRSIYIKNEEEVYIVPYSEKELADMNLRLEDIPQIENSEIYKYHIAESAIVENNSDALGEYRLIKVIFKSDYINEDEVTPFNSMRISVYSRDNDNPTAYQFYGYFADEQDMIPESDKNNNWGASRNYFKDADTASSQKSSRDEQEKDWGKPKEKAEPAIGMTKDEILNSSWGSPDKKNIDEYQWGTEEQWVYDGRGYIYFEDDVVTAIQHR